jgi:hypothetical protein
MRRIFVLFLLVAVSCFSPEPARFGTKVVGTKECIAPQTDYHHRNIGVMGQLQLAAFKPQEDSSQKPDVVVTCGDFELDCTVFKIQQACKNIMAAGYYTLGEDVVHVDHGKANGEFDFSADENHEVGHWYLWHSPHPEFAKMHICPCEMKTMAECWPGGCGRALMNPAARGFGTTLMSSWDGNTEAIDIGMITDNQPTDLDRQFFQAAWEK